MAGLEHVGLENGALLDCPVFPVRVYGAGVLHRDCSRTIAVQSPRVPEECGIGMNEARWGPLVVRPVIVEVPTESGHLETCNRKMQNSFSHPVCPLRAKPDGHPVASVPGDNETKVGHLSKGGGCEFTSIATE